MDAKLLTSPKHRLSRVVAYGFTITLSSFYFGYNIGSFNGCQDSVASALHWGSHKTMYVTMFTAAVPLGAIMTSLVAGTIIHAWGRRRVGIACALLGVAVSLFNMIPNTYTFGVARLLSGGLCGFMATLPPIFLNDVTPVTLFGRMGLAIQTTLTLGIVVGEALALPLPTDDNSANNLNWLWAVVFGFPAIIMLLQVILFLTIAQFESPVWLLKHGKRKEAIAFYSDMYTESGVIEALALVEEKKEIELKGIDVQENTDEKFSYKAYFFHAKYRRMMITSFMLPFLQQWSGINAIFSYSTSMLSFPEFESRVFSLVLGVVNMLTSLITVPLVDKLGRRILMLWGNAGCIVSLIVAGIASLYSITALSIVTLLCFILSFEFSLGPMVWVLCGEILYDEAMSFAVLTNWTNVFLVVLSFPVLETLGIYYCFWLYAGLLIVGEVFFFFFLIETKGLSKKEIQSKILGDS